MKPRSKTSRKPLKKKQNGKRTTKKNTKKHKQTHQARRKKGRVMLGGGNFAGQNDSDNKLANYEIEAQIRAEELYRIGPPGALKAYVNLAGVVGGVFGLIVFFGISRN